jgi:GNAT superfamily N-acetyltransferase
MITLERLRVYDIEATIDLAEEFNTLYGVSKKFNRKKLGYLLELSLYYKQLYFCVVMKDEAKVVGLLVGVASEGVYFDDVVASELGWYVQPEYRGRQSLKMLGEFEAWARDEAKASYIAMAYTEEMSNLATLYTKLGYQPAEHTYKKAL